METDAACGQCGFSLEVADRAFGIAPALQRPIADVAGVLGALAVRRAGHVIAEVERRFPQVGIAVVLMAVPVEAPLLPFAFWLFNRGSLSSAVDKGGANRLVMLLVDTGSDRAMTMVGYGLEPFVQETCLQSCLQAAEQPLRRRRYGQAIESFARELDRQLVELCRLVPRQFGLVDEALWLNAGAAGDGALGMAENLY
ncbi:TPM domain-containing protein [Prosthecobacter fluviatilis]|uniref:TPM domain-containing protein n=1 Tax=Prosthecobacter fluviatilis TaxID=445931 RepID=A0ABW0KVN5_9BACT